MLGSLAFRCAVPAISIHSYLGKPDAEQREALATLIKEHEADVQLNSRRACVQHSTYKEDKAFYFPKYKSLSLPPTSGVHRQNIRESMSRKDFLEHLRGLFLESWMKTSGRRMILFGCRSTVYMERQLKAEPKYSLLVVDHSLKSLSNAAARLVPIYSDRLRFLRSDPFYTCLQLLPAQSVDLVVAPMPVPFFGEKNSYLRLVTCDFLCAVHRVVIERTSIDDPRGFLTFTDSEPYADFILEQLMESKLLVPWVQKKPAETYGRWLPLVGHSEVKEFPQQRFQEVVAIAASKSGQTTPQVTHLIERCNYQRKYYRSLSHESGKQS